MTDKPLPRPRQVTFSGWSIVAGSVLTIMFAFDRVAGLGSLEAQESAADFISTPPGEGLGLSVQDVETAIRAMCLVAGGTAAATAILGWQAMQPSRSARLILSVLAPILFIAGLTSGGLFSALVAAGVAMLWLQPARDWFNNKAPVRDRATAESMSGGTPYPPVVAPTDPEVSSDHPVAPPPPAGSSWDLPHPAPAEGGRATMTDMSEQPYNPYGAPVDSGPRKRPGNVTAAAITTIVASGITFAGLVVSMIYIVSSRADFIVQLDEELSTNDAYQDISPDAVANVAIGFLGVLALWCLIAIVLAVATMRGSNGARITLVVSASLSALVSLLGALVILPLAITIASIATVVLLFTGGAGEWFASRKNAPAAGPMAPPPPPSP